MRDFAQFIVDIVGNDFLKNNKFMLSRVSENL